MINDILHIGDIVLNENQAYLVLDFAEHTETGDSLIVYQDLQQACVRCGLLETFLAKTELTDTNNYSFSQVLISLRKKHKFYVGDIVRHFKYETYTSDEKKCGKGLYKILGYAEYQGEDVVLYQTLYTEAEMPYKVWARPVKMFESKTDTEKYPNIIQDYRFELALRHAGTTTIVQRRA